jgi:hypothetical protein
MTAPNRLWAVTKIAHPALRDVREDCPHCLALTETAISHAAATGSTGATFVESKGDSEHSVTVTSCIQVVVRLGELDAADVTVTADGIVDFCSPPRPSGGR